MGFRVLNTSIVRLDELTMLVSKDRVHCFPAQSSGTVKVTRVVMSDLLGMMFLTRPYFTLLSVVPRVVKYSDVVLGWRMLLLGAGHMGDAVMVSIAASASQAYESFILSSWPWVFGRYVSPSSVL